MIVKNIKRIWPYLKKSKIKLILYAINSIFDALIYSFIPIVGAKIILNITNGKVKEIILSAILVFFINILLVVTGYLKNYLYQKIYQKTIIELQISIANEVLKLNVNEIDKNTTGLFINRMTQDAEEISVVFMDYAYYLSDVIGNIGIFVAIFILNKYMFIYCFICSIILYLVHLKYAKVQYKTRKAFKEIHEEKEGLITEVIRGIRDIKVLNAQKAILEQTNEKIQETIKKENEQMTVKRFYRSITNILNSLQSLGLVILGSILYSKSLITIPSFIIIFNYESRLNTLLDGIAKILEANKNLNVATNRIFEIIDGKVFKKEEFGKIIKEKLDGNIRFQDVTFSYDNLPVLNNMAFEIKPNEKVAFVGKSGAGKTTIFNLITKLYKPQNNQVFLDGIDINDLTRSSIRDNIAIITQSPYIFNFSIYENLKIAKMDATNEEIRNACKLACIDEYIMSLPDGYDTLLGENGIILSGGQKQRIAIARALLSKTKIILFDEATSALDNQTQSKIQDAIDNLQGKYTILIIAHRLSTVKSCDKIFVIDDGKVIDFGTHEYLIKNSKTYLELYKKDLNN